MTYGEYYYLLKYDMKLVNGNWVARKPNTVIPQRMPRDKASAYYSEKFNNYWAETCKNFKPLPKRHS